jgi:dihydroflavonol-4-reductase
MINKYEDQSTDVFVTGATGLLGRWLVPALSSHRGRVFALVRNASERRVQIEADVARLGGDPKRVILLEGDLDLPGLGLDHDTVRALVSVDRIFHLGARFAWGLSEEEALRTNVQGTKRVVELAAALPRGPRLVVVGGYRVAPRVDARGRVRVPVASDFVHAGAYEASKYRAHVAAVESAESRKVPWTAVHPSSVIGDSRTGETSQVTGLGEMIVTLAKGELHARVGGPRTFVPLVPVDFVASFLSGVANREDTRNTEFTLLDPSTPELDALIDRAATRLGVRAPRIRVPTWLVRALPERITRTSSEALGFLDDVRYPADNTDQTIERLGLTRPSIETTFDRWVDFLAGAHAGRANAAA